MKREIYAWHESKKRETKQNKTKSSRSSSAEQIKGKRIDFVTAVVHFPYIQQAFSGNRAFTHILKGRPMQPVLLLLTITTNSIGYDHCSVICLLYYSIANITTWKTRLQSNAGFHAKIASQNVFSTIHTTTVHNYKLTTCIANCTHTYTQHGYCV